MPKPTLVQKALHRDKAVIRAEVATLRSSEADAAAKAKATQAISRTVLKATGLSADGDGKHLLAKLTSALLDNGSVGLSGIDMAIKGVALRLNIPQSEIDSIPEAVKQRLDKLV